MDTLNAHVSYQNRLNGLHDSIIPVLCPETYAQTAEDVIVASLLKALFSKQRRDMSTAFYIEIGANQPISTSNTFLLYRRYNARGVLVEANPDLISDLASARPRDTVINTAICANRDTTVTLHIGKANELSSISADHVNSFGDFGGKGGIIKSVTVPSMHINALLSQYKDRPIDLLSIDCEGLDYDLLAALDYETYAPQIIQCEPSEHFIPGNRANMIKLLENRSYRLAAMTDINLIFQKACF